MSRHVLHPFAPAWVEELRRAVACGEQIAPDVIVELLDAADALREVLDAMGCRVRFLEEGVYEVDAEWRVAQGKTIGAAFRASRDGGEWQ